MKLTNAAVRGARPQARAYRLADGQGLHLAVLPTGSRCFRMRYRDAGGREQLLSIGQWPAVTLDQARARRDEARAQLARGEDPRAARGRLTFADAAAAWLEHRAASWSAVHAADVAASLARDALPAIGALPLDSVTRPGVLALVAAVERRGAIETGRRLRQRVEAIFAFARAQGWTSADNPADVGEALAYRGTGGRQAALLEVDELQALTAAVEALPAAPGLKLASRFLALTAVRLGALRGMRWSEVEDLDGPAPIWRVPAARMKLGVSAKLDQAHDHVVPLSPAAVAVLKVALSLGGGELVFAGRGGEAPIGAGALAALYARAGFAGRHVAHGWRASFSTVMNERRPADQAAIDRALGHRVKGMTKVEAAYNRAQHLQLRREILAEWAEVLGG
jgi:integrase